MNLYKKTENRHRTPTYYVRKRLFANKPAVFGLVVIVFTFIVGLLGFLIMPDSQPEGSADATIKNSPPFFKTPVLRIRQNFDVEKINLFEKMLFGEPGIYQDQAISDYRIESDTLYYRIGTEEFEMQHDLLDIVRAVSTDNPVRKVQGELEDTLFYTDISEGRSVETFVTLSRLEDEFMANNIYERTYYLGTQQTGRDILSMLIYGARISIGIGISAVLISLILGISLGAIGGFFGGFIDEFILWLMTVVWSVPSIILVIAIGLAFETKGIVMVFLAVGLTMWVETARVVRGEIKSIKSKLYIDAARAFGFNNFYIIYKHILPNLLGSIIIITTSNFATAILVEAGLSFLGLGVDATTPSWGKMIKEGLEYITSSNGWYLWGLPGLCTCLLVLAFNLLGNGLRDAFDPKMSSK